MKVFLDEQQIEVKRPSLRAAMSTAIGLANGAGRVVIEVYADGEPLPSHLLDEPSDEPLHYDELRFTSAIPSVMVQQILLDAADALDRVREDQESAASQIQEGRLSDARRSLEQVVSLWQLVVLAVQRGGALLDRDLTAIKAGDPPTPIADRIGTLRTDLESLAAALGDEDWSALSDALEDDMGVQVEDWQDALKIMADEVAKSG